MKHTCYALFVLCLTLLLLFASCTSQEQEESTVSDTSPATQPAQTLDVGADSDTHTEPITEEESLPSPIDTNASETSAPADSNADAETLPAEPDPKALMETLSKDHYDVVLVNIVADVIIGLAPVLPEFLGKNTTLICSGILDVRLPEVTAALEQAGLSVISVYQKEDWRCVRAKRRNV